MRDIRKPLSRAFLPFHQQTRRQEELLLESMDDHFNMLVVALKAGDIDEEDLALLALALNSDGEEDTQPLEPSLDLSSLTSQC